MSDMSLPWVVATVETLQGYGIDTEGARKSLTGDVTTEGEGETAIIHDSHLVVIHLQNLSIEQFVSVRFDADVQVLSYAQVQELMETEEWSAEETP